MLAIFVILLVCISSWRWGWSARLFCAIGAFVALADVTSGHFLAAWRQTTPHDEGPLMWLVPAAYCGLLGAIRDEESWQRLFTAWTVAGIVAAIAALAVGGSRLEAPFGNPDFLAQFILFALGFSLLLPSSWLLAAAQAVLVAAFVGAASRGAALGLLAGAAAVGSLRWRRLALVVMAAGAVFAWRWHLGVHSVPRPAIWAAWGNFIAVHPLVGNGQASDAFVYNSVLIDRGYNAFLDLWATGGIGAVLAYCALVAAIAFRVGHLLVAVLVAYLASAFFTFDTLGSLCPLAVLGAYADRRAVA